MENKIGIEKAEAICLKGESSDGKIFTAHFLPSKGMNLISYKKGDLEVIDQTTWPLFEERFAGLGAMIGPHFHHRQLSLIPKIPDLSLFPHAQRIFEKGGNEPFSHGIGRCAPWTIENKTDQALRAILSGEDIWKGIELKELEGQNFKMSYEAAIIPEGLEISLSVKGETEALIGLHTYYALPSGKGVLQALVEEKYVDKSEYRPIPSSWNYSDHLLTYSLDKETDYGFHPFPDLLHGDINLACETHRIRVQYWCDNEENSFQVWHPLGASFVCIEPLSAKDPRKPKLTVNRLKILISIH